MFGKHQSTDKSIVMVNDDTDSTQEREECEEKLIQRNPRVPILKEPYPLNRRLPSEIDSKQTADLKIAEAMYLVCESVTLKEAIHAKNSAK